MAMDAPDTTIPAASLITFRNAPGGGDPEILMTERSGKMRFAAGAAVFPGGRIDPADRALAAALGTGADLDDRAARIAAVRETIEETGLVLAIDRPIDAAEARDARDCLIRIGNLAGVLDRFGWTLRLDRLCPFARWRPNFTGAFDTRFYLADLGTGQVDIAADGAETARLFWVSAARALAMAQAGEIHIIFPTRRNLERLALFPSFAQACAHAAAVPIRPITPVRAERDGEPWLVIPDDHGYPILGAPIGEDNRS